MSGFPIHGMTGSSRKSVEFDDNRLLAMVCGAFDKNLVAIEQGLGVEIFRRGNFLVVHGKAENVHMAEMAGEVLETLYQRANDGRPVAITDVDATLRMLIRQPEQSQMPDYGSDKDQQCRIEIRTRKKAVEPGTNVQKIYIKTLLSNELTFAIGPAGTGKTYLAVAVGVNMFLNGHVDRIIMSRPAVEAGEKLGYLPGDLKDKVDPYMQPLYDALNDFLPAKQVAKYLDEKRFEIVPLAFMRGRTLSNAFIVLDETQNATAIQMKMFLTRLGQGSRMAITGNLTQIDLPRGVPSGLSEARQFLRQIPSVGFSFFTAQDVVRHPLVTKIIEAYSGNNA